MPDRRCAGRIKSSLSDLSFPTVVKHSLKQLIFGIRLQFRPFHSPTQHYHPTEKAAIAAGGEFKFVAALQRDKAGFGSHHSDLAQINTLIEQLDTRTLRDLACCL